ncbi:6,7-dimethyl-8-ribityllumazine synthase, partial [Staphylococcus epidermidis]
KKLPQKRQYHPLITLPSLITAPTSHYHYLSNQLPKPLSKPNHISHTPLIFPLLTTQTFQQPLQTLIQPTTTLLIPHPLSTIKKPPQI